MIDLSDGLSRDLRHICQQSHLGAEVWADRIPIHEDAIEMRRDGHSPLEHALHDGEDHELLFTCGEPRFSGAAIGRIVEGSEIQVQTKDGLVPLEPRGWEHKL